MFRKVVVFFIRIFLSLWFRVEVENVDRFENGELVEEGKADGKFSADDAAGLTSFLIDNMIGQENLDDLYDFYLKKYSLEETAEA